MKLILLLASVFCLTMVKAEPMRDGLWEISTSVEMKINGRTNKMPPQVRRQCLRKEEFKNLPKAKDLPANFVCKTIKEERKGEKIFTVQECSGGGITHIYSSVGTYREDYMEIVTEMKIKGSKDVSRSTMIAKRVGDCK
ncbi:MAG: DUF3617 family protein [Aquificaceae bacterium]